MVYSRLQIEGGKEKTVTTYNLQVVKNALLKGKTCWLMTFNTKNIYNEPYMDLKLSLSVIDNFKKIH